MKKHLIDDFFLKKLAEHQEKPSQEAFKKFQARLQQKPKKFFFLVYPRWVQYAAVGSIAIAFSVLFLHKKVIFIELITAENKQTEEMTYPVSKNIDKKISKNTSRINFAMIKKKSRPSEADVLKNITAKSVGIITQPRLNESQNIPTNIAENLKIIENPIIEPALTTQKVMQEILEDSIVSLPVIIAAKPENLRAGTPLNGQNIITSPFIEEKEPSLISKIYGEYKHFKYGEKVDWRGLGIKNIFARLDDSAIKEDVDDVRNFIQRKIGRFQRKE